MNNFLLIVTQQHMFDLMRKFFFFERYNINQKNKSYLKTNTWKKDEILFFFLSYIYLKIISVKLINKKKNLFFSSFFSILTMKHSLIPFLIFELIQTCFYYCCQRRKEKKKKIWILFFTKRKESNTQTGYCIKKEVLP